MKRGVLVRLVEDAVATAGYAFHTGEVHTAGGTVRRYPAAWLAPPVLKGLTGRGEGEQTWRVALHLMALPEATTSAEEVWRGLEADAAAIARAIAVSNEVCSVGAVGGEPRRQSITAHGEASVTLTCDVTIWYYS